MTDVKASCEGGRDVSQTEQLVISLQKPWFESKDL